MNPAGRLQMHNKALPPQRNNGPPRWNNKAPRASRRSSSRCSVSPSFDTLASSAGSTLANMGVGRKGEATSVEIASAVIFYCLCSGGMLLVNKLAVHHIPLPGLVTASQFFSCAVVVYSGKLGGCLEMDDFEWSKAKYFIIYVVSFTIGTYTNMKVLSMANVETVIGMRQSANALFSPACRSLPALMLHALYPCTPRVQSFARAHPSLSPSSTTSSTTARSRICARARRCC